MEAQNRHKRRKRHGLRSAKKHFLCFATSLLAAQFMKQTSRIIDSRGLTIVVEAPNGRKPSEVEVNEFE